MANWQKPVRIGVAVFLIAFGVVVYRSIREREPAPLPPRVERLDPKAVMETTAATLLRERGEERELDMTWERLVSYEDGSTRYFVATIVVRRPDGRIFTIRAREAYAGANQVQLELTGEVALEASDGFRLQTDRATFDRTESIARVPGAVAFQKGTMSGSGLGATYDERNDVLTLKGDAHVMTVDGTGRTTLDARAGSATLDRLNDVLFLEAGVEVHRGAEVITAGSAVASLSSDDSVVTRLELRGDGSVTGGASGIESMAASAIDLDYSDDGTRLERVVLNGSAGATLAGNGQAAGRRIEGGSLDLHLAEDGTLTTLTGRERVRLDLPASGDAPLRSISADSLDGSGEPGQGLRRARFRGAVEFREGRAGRGSMREARADTLDLALDGDVVGSARFGGGVTFDDQDLHATAPEARYEPEAGTLSLSGGQSQSARVTDDRIDVAARTIDVAVGNRDLTARGTVRTTLRGRAAGAGKSRDTRLPGLLQEGAAASINAEELVYDGDAARAVYSGATTLVQGETAIRADRLSLDERRGDLEAAGSARSSLVLGGDRFEGRADVIRYVEATRLLTYSMTPAPPTSEGGARAGSGRSGPAPRPAPRAQVNGPDGDLYGERIEVALGPDGNDVDRLEAHTRVTVILGTRTAIGQRLVFHARDERYEVSGDGTTPVSIRETSSTDRSCRETTGRTLTFFKSTDRIVVDGSQARRTETGPCGPEPSR
jgi:LPS export ABC transporter protein LptC